MQCMLYIYLYSYIEYEPSKTLKRSQENCQLISIALQTCHTDVSMCYVWLCVCVLIWHRGKHLKNATLYEPSLT